MRDLLRQLGGFKRRRASDIKAFIRFEDGNVESSLVLIPLLILFLICLELIIATNLRNGDFAIAQGDASRRAISGQIQSTDEVIELNSPDPYAHIRVLISRRRTGLPQLVPGLIALMGGAPTIDVKGAAIMEPVN
ncbi:MAG: hypothetical protein F2954_06270 [Actinobacteria bacterium]|uniref:Unannotated protein n=1 Tax=freshwater metagenome TaxID=449393 RepID=A0A6J7VZB2_9ZZZZ|nr:hypothetical protein [Actinomycetota bacterium]